MNHLYSNLSTSADHLKILNAVFANKKNYSNSKDYYLYEQNLKEVNKLSKDLALPDQIYSRKGRQMILADIIEYIFFSRGIFSLMSGGGQLKSKNIPKFIKLILHFVNLLMLYEITTVDSKIRGSFLLELKKNISQVGKEEEYSRLIKWKKPVGLKKGDNPAEAPSDYFDSLLPKTAGGLWHEMLVYAFLLRYNIGYIFPLLLHQKVISLDAKLSPPDFVILHKKTKRYFGIEVGDLKERQSGGFMAPSGIPVIPIDTRDCRISDRCPECKKWIGIPPKVIEEFSDPNYQIKDYEIRSLYDSKDYTLQEKIEGVDPYIKYFDGKYHYHYQCVLDKKLRKKVIKDIMRKHRVTQGELTEMFKKKVRIISTDGRKLSKKVNYLKTHYLWYPELSKLI